MRLVCRMVSFMFLFCSFSVFVWPEEVYFTPSQQCEREIILRIDKAKTKIDAAVYSITNKKIVTALIEAHKRGVYIRILTDRMQAGQKSSKVSELEKAGINLLRHKKHRILHNKFAVFDENQTVSGSYNWTESASNKNSEDCLFLSLPQDECVLKYQERFNQLWELNQ